MNKSKVPAPEENIIQIPAESILQTAEADVSINYAALFRSAIEEQSDDKKWQNGDFIGIKTLSNTKVGSVGQNFIERLCEVLKVPIVFPTNKNKKRLNQSPWDIQLHKITFELKTATEDTTGKFQFNHIRYHRDYQAVLCLGVSPNDLYFNIYSKAEIATGDAGKLVSMEKGGNASYKLTKSKSELYRIDEFQNRLQSFAEIFLARKKK